MLSVLSPAKTLDYETQPTTRKSTQPLFIDEAASLIGQAQTMNPEDIQALMGVSANIAALNHERFMNWQPNFSLKNAKQESHGRNERFEDENKGQAAGFG